MGLFKSNGETRALLDIDDLVFPGGIVLAALLLVLFGLVIGFFSYKTRVAMVENGYEQRVVPGRNEPIWVKAESAEGLK